MSIVVNKTRLPVTQWQTESGSVVSVSDARKRYAKSLSVALEPIQDLHGYANPWVGGAGKNLLGTTLYTGVSYNPTVGADWSGRSVSVNQFTPNADNSVFTVTLGSWASRAMFVEVEPNIAYKLQCVLSGDDCATTYGWLDENNLVLSKYNTTGATVTLTPSLTSPNNAKWFYLLIAPRSHQQTLTFTQPQFEKGSTATAYEPYENLCPISGTSSVTAYRAGVNQSDNPQYVTLSLGQTVYGASVDLVSGVMTVTEKSVTFIGDNTYYWYTYAPSNYDSFCFNVDLPDKSKKKLTSICDKYKNVDVSWGAGGDGKYCVFSDHATLTRLYFRPPYSGFGETVADWKTWLSNNPLQVCYELATPQTIQLSKNQIEMLMRNNTVWSDAGVVTLEYARIRQ